MNGIPRCLIVPPFRRTPPDLCTNTDKGRMLWQKTTGYGRRSLVETAIGRHKQVIAPTLRACSKDGQAGEAAIAVQIHNRVIRIAKPISARLPELDR